MSLIRVLGRFAGAGAARVLCARYGAALILAVSLTLAGGASLYLGQQANQATPRVPTADAGQSAGCWSHELEVAYLPETNQLYCLPDRN